MDPATNTYTKQLKALHKRRRYLLYQLFALHIRINLLHVSTFKTCVDILFQLDLMKTKKLVCAGRAVGSKNLKRRRTSTWITDYIGDSPIYPPALFRRRFAIPITLFHRLLRDLREFNPEFWTQRRKGFGTMGHTPEQRILSSLKLLSYGCSNDSLDDGSSMSEESVRISFQYFCNDVISMYKSEFLNRRPTREELSTISSTYSTVGFPGCIGAVDCMKLYWKNCPLANKGQLLNTKESSNLATVVCEAWKDHDLYCWNWYPGRAGTNNDLTVLYSSPLFNDIFNGLFKVDNNDVFLIPPSTIQRTIKYFLTDGIYPDWPLFVKPIHNAVTDIAKFMSARQEATRKDIERLFGVLQSRFRILRLEFEHWSLDNIIMISNTCVILHNIIVRMQQHGDFYNECGDVDVVTELLDEEHLQSLKSKQEFENNIISVHNEMQKNIEDIIDDIVLNEVRLTDSSQHDSLMNDLAQHLWNNKQLFN